MSIHPTTLHAGLTRAEQVRARAFSLAIETVAGRGHRTFLDVFTRAEEIEVWLYKAREPRILPSTSADVEALAAVERKRLTHAEAETEASRADRLDPYGT